ncbi:MAG: sulfatase-like hydrolase/transferase, partial [Planctomycetota bacterium]
VAVSEQVGIGAGSYFHPYTRVDPKLPALPTSTGGKSPANGAEYLVDRVNAEAVDFLQKPREQPFFLYVSHYAVRTSLLGKPDLVDQFGQKPEAGDGQYASRNNPHLAAMLKTVDDGVGQIMQALEEQGVADNTIVIVTSDNGGDRRFTSNGRLRGGKSQLYEGGIRVPLVVRWPAKVEAGAVCTTYTISTDFYATMVDLLQPVLKNDSPPQIIDGVSIAPLLEGGDLAERPIAWYYPRDKPHFLGGRPCDAIRLGNWKLLEFFDDGHRELYNLSEDPNEHNDLSAVKTGKVDRLAESLAAWREDMTGDPDGNR